MTTIRNLVASIDCQALGIQIQNTYRARVGNTLINVTLAKHTRETTGASADKAIDVVRARAAVAAGVGSTLINFASTYSTGEASRARASEAIEAIVAGTAM